MNKQEEPETPEARKTLAYIEYSSAKALLELGSPILARSLFERYEQLMRDMATEWNTPEAQYDLAFALLIIAGYIQKLDGYEKSKPLIEEGEQLMRKLAVELKTPEARENLAYAVCSLAKLTQVLDGPEKARPLFEEYEQLMRGLADESSTPEMRETLAFAVFSVADFTQKLEGAEKARPLYEEVEQLMRGLADELKTPEARKNLVYVVYHLAELIQTLDGPDKARPLFEEQEQLMCDLAKEIGNPEYILQAILFRRYLIISDALGSDLWSNTFALEILSSDKAKASIPKMLQVYADLDVFLKTNKIVNDAGKRGGVLYRLSLFRISAGEYQQALTDAENSLPDIRAYVAKKGLVYTQDILCKVLFNLGRARVLTDDIQGGLDAYTEALPLTQSEAYRDPFAGGRQLAVLHWFFAEALELSDQPGNAKRQRLDGLKAAKEFAKFAAQDGLMILKAYEDKLA